jgi:hypothetical protein
LNKYVSNYLPYYTASHQKISTHNFSILQRIWEVQKRKKYLTASIFRVQEAFILKPRRQSYVPSNLWSISIKQLGLIFQHIVTYPGCAWLIRRVLDLMNEFIGPLYNWLQQFTNHYLTHCHLPTGHSTGTIVVSEWTPLYSAPSSDSALL